jgi:hypothetical protein
MRVPRVLSTVRGMMVAVAVVALVIAAEQTGDGGCVRPSRTHHPLDTPPGEAEVGPGASARA